MSEATEAIVIDNGSGVVKAGYAGEDTPRSVFATYTGKVKNPEWFAAQAPSLKGDLRDRETFVGAECQQYRDFLELVNPINRGIVEDWDSLEQIWEYIFAHELRINPETATMPILCTSSPSGSRQQQEKMAQIMFESQKACGFYVMHQCVLSLFASGRTRGIVVEVGHGSSHAIPIFEGYALPHAALHYNVGGMDISHRLHKLLAKRGHSFHLFQGQTINEIKEAAVVMGSMHDRSAIPPQPLGAASEGNQVIAEDGSKPFELPDGTILHVDKHTRLVPAEILFKPQDLGEEHPMKPTKGLHELVAESISMCDKDLQKDLYDAVILAGGTTMMPGFSKRFQEELMMLTKKPRLCVVPDAHVRERGYNSHRKIAAWIGGSIFASLPTFRDVHITKQEWEEYHEAIFDRKCF
ncbi:hypothetical protein Poli38472_008644 [Pythium oligandrum]|uniref:Actin n=1 Tax=Pythium oligandrum TaxID=41045 RepID=A0A8K1FBD4_PYTOL|nr:hypothetical protein Poli38472_008644 [Pythium oligandrum]|eukprot:TMW55996.1 hypothetical protein Poli38472_008644 [Pythium oligandrum]